MIDFDIRHNSDLQYLPVLHRMLNPELIWYVGKWEQMGMMKTFKKVAPPAASLCCALSLTVLLFRFAHC